MQWIILLFLGCLLTSCIFVEGQIIEEPKDVVISRQAYQLTPDFPCQSEDVTQAERIKYQCPLIIS